MYSIIISSAFFSSIFQRLRLIFVILFLVIINLTRETHALQKLLKRYRRKKKFQEHNERNINLSVKKSIAHYLYFFVRILVGRIDSH